MREGDVIALLRQRYGRTYRNGSTDVLRYIGASHVRFGPLWPRAIADFLVLDTWGNSGPEHRRHPLLGFEVKVSRSDYLSEIRNLDKSLPFREVCAEFSIVAPRGVVRNDLPDGWGYLEVRGSRLYSIQPPAVNDSPKSMPRGLIAGFMRAAAAQAFMEGIANGRREGPVRGAVETPSEGEAALGEGGGDGLRTGTK